MQSTVLITRLATVFGTPEHTADPPAYIKEIARLISSYGEDEQNRAADALIRSHRPNRQKPWPTPFDICEACIAARDATVLSRQASQPEKWPEWSAAASRTALDLIRSELGQQAADQGWVAALWDFCRRQRRLPNEAEAHRCRMISKEFDEAYASFCANPGLPVMAAAIRKGFENRFEQRNMLARAAYGEVVEGVDR